MAFNVKTTMTWSVPGPEQPHDLVDARNNWLIAAVASGKTSDEVVAPVSEDGKVSERMWDSQESAAEWKKFITDLASKNGLTVQVEIS